MITAPKALLDEILNGVLDCLDATGDFNFYACEVAPVALRPTPTPIRPLFEPETHFLVAAQPRTACQSGRQGDSITNESTEVDCLACLTVLAQAREHRLRQLLGGHVGMTEAGACVVDNATGHCLTHDQVEA